MALEKELQIKTLSSLAKVFHERILGKTYKRAYGFRGEEVCFQVAYRRIAPRYDQKNYEIKIDSEICEYVSLSTVEFIPSMLPAYPDRLDKGYITSKPTLFPDALVPLKSTAVSAAAYNWRSLWVSVKLPENIEIRDYPVVISFIRKGKTCAKTCFTVSVRPEILPKNDFIFTQWFHCDCIADVHNVPVFSEKHWCLIEKYMRLAAEHGMNMILTPVLTPPLDTAVGSERPTVQLVGVTKNDNGYEFDFSLLGRFIETAKRCGIENFEINHFFTQWGAKFTPKVVAKVNGKSKKIFGWNVSSTSEEYARFLSALIPKLIAFFESVGTPREKLYFHVSDEPYEKDIEQYNYVSDLLRPLIEECHHIDALSSLSFYKKGLISTPVVPTNHIHPFIDEGVSELWCYYCCSQPQKVSNRFFALPSPRTRAIGVQMYKYGIKGFLHWGYNFYYSQFSTRKIDPWRESDSGEAFPSGDPFSVYPYLDGAIPSLRQKVFRDALNDMRLLSLAEKKIGKEKLVAELDRIMGEPVRFDTCPESERFFDELYKMIFSYLES